VKNFDVYAASPGIAPQIDIFVEEGTRYGAGIA
jgi:hypothetical protein